MEPNIELAKSRDFGETISDSFIFIRQNLKPLLKNYFIFCGFFMLAGIVTSSLQQIKMHRMLSNINSYDANSYVGMYNRSGLSFLGIEYILNIVFMLFGYTAITVSTLCYIALYKERGNTVPRSDEVWGYFKYYFFRIFGSSLLLGLLLIVGFVFCLIPGFYLYPILSLIYPIMIFENTTFGYAFNRSFTLIKNNWWITFGSLVIAVIIIYFATAIVVLPTSIINGISLFTHSQKTKDSYVPLSIVTSVLQQACQFFLVLPLITGSLCYFNLVETKDGTGLLERINKFGDQTPGSNLPAEEY